MGVFSDGTCVRDYLHVLDLAQGHVLALDALRPESTVFDPKADHFFKGYNLGRGTGLSVLQILEAMRKATGFDYKYEIIGRRYATFCYMEAKRIADTWIFADGETSPTLLQTLL